MDKCRGKPEGDITQAEEEDNFKPIYKKYKRRDKPLDITNVIDFEKMQELSSTSIKRVKPIIPSQQPIVGLRPAQQWSIFQFVDHAGFYVIRNPFLAGGQRYWTSRCLQDLPRPPHPTNLIVHPDLDPDTLWDSFLKDFGQRGREAFNNSCPLRKLRWTTIGYHYHWDSKEYKEEDHTPFPQDIAVLTHYIACVLGFPQFQAEAGIINYYHPDSALGAHTDHSELDHDAPLISISFGQDAIFLIGGLTKAQTPTALLLHSGDICVMSGEARLVYHAVPRILPSQSGAPPPCFDMAPDDWKMMDSWADCVGNVPGCDGDQQRSPLTHSDHTTPESCSALRAHTVSSSKVRDSPTPAMESSCHVCSPESPLRMCSSHTAVEDNTSASTHNTKSCAHSQDSDFSTEDRNLSLCVSATAQHTNSRPEECDSAAMASSFNTQTSMQHADSTRQESDSLSALYEDRVKEVNHQLIDVLRKQDWGPFAAYLSSSRLNLNIRQVLKAGHSFDDAGRQDSPVLVKKPRTDMQA